VKVPCCFVKELEEQPSWTAAACFRFGAGSLLPDHAARKLVRLQNGYPQQTMERKAAADCSSATDKTSQINPQNTDEAERIRRFALC
jgi:hypothetical protein